MFETDDFDEVLSQFDIPKSVQQIKSETNNRKLTECTSLNITTEKESEAINRNLNTKIISENINNARVVSRSEISLKHCKRKIIDSHFDHSTKRKFPGPAGLLSKTIEETKDENICHLELLSQDIDFTQNHLRRDIFDSPLWKRLNVDLISWKLNNIDTINEIKQQAQSGNLRRRKAQVVTAFVEAVDRSVTDPLIILRDKTGSIKCTLHRDAWYSFSPYIVSEYCILILYQPTVLTTGSAFKKHYLNITLSNIYAVYSSAVLKDDMEQLPDGYSIVHNEDFTVIKTEQNQNGTTIDFENGQDVLDDLDAIFSDDLF